MTKRKVSMALVSLLVLCLVWMDACLYFQIQTMDADDEQPAATSPASGGHHNSTGQSHTELPFAMQKFSFAFQGMSVKLMMTDPVDNYLLAPLSEAFADTINFKENLKFISANMVSYAGVLSALIAAKLVTYDSLTLHRLSYVMFQVRTWLDDLDGAVARSRLGIHKHVSLQKTSGYVVDGVCDAIGFVAYVIGCYIFLKGSIKRMHRRLRGSSQRYNLQSITEVKSGDAGHFKADEDYSLLTHTKDHQTSDTKQDVDVDYSIEDDDYYYEDDMAFDNGQDQDDDDDDDQQILHDAYNRVNYDKSGTRSSRIILKNRTAPKSNHLVFYRYIKEKIKKNLSNRHLVLLITCFLLQVAMCATFWNRYILVYQDLLESPSVDDQQHRAKRKILKSNIMYIIIWFWRLTNGHSLMQMLITSVFFGKLWQFLEFIKYIGFVEIIILATVTELHIIDVRNYLSNI